jgi:hypothetical protein
LVQPKFLGDVGKDGEFWDYGELLVSNGPWLHDGPVAIYPLQISERMRAQRGWFTMFGNKRDPLEKQFPDVVARIDLDERGVEGAREFLTMAGIQPYAVYPDLDHLGAEVVAGNRSWVETAVKQAARRAARKKK